MPEMMKWQAAMPMAPETRTGLRPSLSTYMTAGTGEDVSVMI